MCIQNGLGRHHWSWARLLDFSGSSRFSHHHVIQPWNFKAPSSDYGKAPTISLTAAICPLRTLLMSLELLAGHSKSLSLISVMWFINNETGIKDHHLVYWQSPLKESGITPWISLDPGRLGRWEFWCGYRTHRLNYFLTIKLVNCTRFRVMLAPSISQRKLLDGRTDRQFSPQPASVTFRPPSTYLSQKCVQCSSLLSWLWHRHDVTTQFMMALLFSACPFLF